MKFNQIKLKCLQKKSVAVKEKTDIRSVHTRSSQGGIDLTESKCFLCEEPAGSAGLHNVSINDTDAKVRRCDTALLAKLAPGDMIALEAKYHLKCLSTLYNRARATDSTSSDSDSNAHLYGIAFAELVAFMEDLHKEESVAPIFKLKDLAHMYIIRLKQLGVTTENRIQTSMLKNRLLSVITDQKACW